MLVESRSVETLADDAVSLWQGGLGCGREEVIPLSHGYEGPQAVPQCLNVLDSHPRQGSGLQSQPAQNALPLALLACMHLPGRIGRQG